MRPKDIGPISDPLDADEVLEHSKQIFEEARRIIGDLKQPTFSVSLDGEWSNAVTSALKHMIDLYEDPPGLRERQHRQILEVMRAYYIERKTGTPTSALAAAALVCGDEDKAKSIIERESPTHNSLRKRAKHEAKHGWFQSAGRDESGEPLWEMHVPGESMRRLTDAQYRKIKKLVGTLPKRPHV